MNVAVVVTHWYNTAVLLIALFNELHKQTEHSQQPVAVIDAATAAARTAHTSHCCQRVRNIERDSSKI